MPIPKSAPQTCLAFETGQLTTWQSRGGRLFAHQVGQLRRIVVVLVRNIRQRHLAAADRLELGDADARAVELPYDVLRRALGPILGVLWDEISRPD